nr:MAG TPA: hypothetical protein [Caudoviricetes sp.]DAY37483.1 MAG TPA: hypothetical protein [Caudoviricetes sp.]
MGITLYSISRQYMQFSIVVALVNIADKYN